MISVREELKYDKNKLKKSYEDALKKDEFKTFISKLKIDDEILMKYTSILEESCKEYNNCINCDGISCCKNKILGYAYLPKIINSNLQFSYKPCRYKIKQDKKYEHLKNVKYYNLPNTYKDASWEKVDKRLSARREAITWLANFIKERKNKGLYLNGTFGSGKTYLVVSTFNELAKKNVKSAIIFWPEFLRDLKSSFDTDYEDKLNYIKNVELLLIDDIGAEVATSWSRDEILCPILQHRMDNNLATFFTSNLTIDALEQHLSQTRDGVEVVKAKRITERIRFLTDELEMVSKNMRN